MSFDLVETGERLATLPGVSKPPTGAFDNFLRGTGMYTMQGFAKAGRAASFAVGGAVAAAERLGELEPFGKIDTTLSDAVFKFHDDVMQSAVDHWTPKPSETGVAAEIAGTLLSTLPLAIASPGAAVAATQLAVGEDLARKGVPGGKAGIVGAVQGVGLGLGIWAPMLGRTGWERMLVGGAGFNVAQGIATRGVSGTILAGTKAEGDFKAFDWEAITLDALLGLAFGGIAHLSPAQRAQGENAWKRIADWTKGFKPSDVDALAALRLGEHLNVESAPGKLTALEDIDANTRRARTAIDQLAQDKPVQVEDLPAPKFELDPERQAAAERIYADMQAEAAALGKAYDIVLREPIGPAQDPMVRLTPENIGEVLVERGPAFQKQGKAELQIPGYGLVKFIWRHGEKSPKAKAVQVTREDVTRLPEVMRNFEPIEDITQPDGKRLLEWQVERADGKKVVYSVRGFTEGDGKQHVVSIFVNEGKEKRFADKPLSSPKGGPDSPGGGSKPRAAEAATGDTGPGSFASQPDGQAKATLPPDPLQVEAARFTAENPDVQLTVGRNPDGTPITKSAKDFLADAEGVRAQAAADAKLFEVAAACMLGAA